MTPRRTDRKPDWRAVTYEALLEPSRTMRVLAGLGFHAYHGTISRGTIRWWQPPYLFAASNNPHRPCFARVNRAMRDAEVHILSDADRRITAVCSYEGEWRTADGAQRGDDLASLGALRWGCRYGQAASRIARLIGLDRIPALTPMTASEVFASVHERMREVEHA